MSDQFPAHWTPEMKAEAQRRLQSESAPADEFPSHWTPEMKAAARERMAASDEPDEKPKSAHPARVAMRGVLDQGIENAASAMPLLGPAATLTRRLTKPGTLTNVTTKAAPVVIGTLAGGWPGVAAAGSTGLLGSATRGAISDEGIQPLKVMGDAALDAGGQVLGMAGPAMKAGSSKALQLIAGLSKRADADKILKAGRGMLTRPNALALEAAEQTAARSLPAGVKALPNRGVQEFRQAVEQGRGADAPFTAAGMVARMARPAVSGAAQLAHRAGRSVPFNPGIPPLVAMFLRQLMGEDE